MDLVPDIAKLYFTGRFGKKVQLSHKLQQGILAACGLQRKSLDTIAAELQIEPTQVRGLFKRLIKSVFTACNEIEKADCAPHVEARLTAFVEKEQSQDEAKTFSKKADQKLIESLENEYGIKGTEEEWSDKLNGGRANGDVKDVSMKSFKESRSIEGGKKKHKNTDGGENQVPKKKKKKMRSLD